MRISSVTARCRAFAAARGTGKLPAAAAVLLLCAALAAAAQEATPEPEFEAASLKPSPPSDFDRMAALMSTRLRMTCGLRDPVRFVCNRMSLRDLTVEAYGILDYQLTGPAWMSVQRFDIAAKVPPGTTRERADLMLRRLLADRFKMTVHRESKEMAVYALRVGPHGHKLKEVKAAADPAGSNNEDTGKRDEKMAGVMKNLTESLNRAGGGYGARSTFGDARVSELVRALSDELGHPVVDETGLKGKYDFDIEFAPAHPLSATLGGGPFPTGTDSGSEPLTSPFPAISQAVQNQLGLKLEPAKAQVEILVIDQAEKTPEEN